MKTRTEFEAMSKTKLDAYGNQTFGIDLDHRRKKSDMIDELMRLQESNAVQQPVNVVPDDQVRVTVTDYSSSSGVLLFVNGRSFNLPIGKTVTIPAFVLPSLEAVPDVAFTKE